MNLNAIVAGPVGNINPAITGTLKVSAGSTTRADGIRTPNFDTFPGVSLQVQPLTTGDLKQLDALNIQNVERAVYMNGNIQGLNRKGGMGGDILVFGNPATTWLVTAVIEPWDANGWTKVGVTQQTVAA